MNLTRSFGTEFPSIDRLVDHLTTDPAEATLASLGADRVVVNNVRLEFV